MNPSRRLTLAAPLVLLAMIAAPVEAHHGWGNYDADRPLTLTGTVIESAWENPHGSLRLKVDDRVWLVILAPPSRMDSRGLPREGIRPGATVTVAGYPHRSGSSELRAERVTTGDRTTELR